jgi:hypothetical protein
VRKASASCPVPSSRISLDLSALVFVDAAGEKLLRDRDPSQEEMMTTPLIIQQTMPGSHGEHDLQERYGTWSRAEAFYKHQVLNYLNPQMRTFIARQEMFFLSTADGHGECDVSFRAGEAGFVHVLDEKILVYAEYRGNGVLASLGNIAENPHAGLLFIDFFRDKIGLHVNGAARILSNEELLTCRGFRRPASRYC